MRTKIVMQLTSLALLLALSVAGGCGKDANDQAKAADPAQSAPVTATVTGGREGDLAPDFTLARLAGGDLQLSSLRGKTVIVDFWDTWCAPCRRALPHLQELSVAYPGELVVVGVAFGREGEAKVRRFVEQNGLTFEMLLLNAESTVLEDFGGIRSIPTTYLIGADGIIRKKWEGAADKHVYESAVQAALAGKSQAG